MSPERIKGGVSAYGVKGAQKAATVQRTRRIMEESLITINHSQVWEYFVWFFIGLGLFASGYMFGYWKEK